MLQSNHLIGFGAGGVSLPPPTGADIIPTMTGGTTSGVTISSTQEYLTNYAWKVGDNSSGTTWRPAAGAPSFPCQIVFDFGAGAEKYVASYTMTSNDTSGRMPSAWDFQGSNDGSSYTTIESRSSETFSVPNGKNTYTLSSVAGPYRYYRVSMTAGGGTLFEIREMELIY